MKPKIKRPGISRLASESRKTVRAPAIPDMSERTSLFTAAGTGPNHNKGVSVWLKNTADALTRREVAPQKKLVIESLLSDYLQHNQGSPHQVPIHEMTGFINSKPSRLRPKAARALLFFYEHVKPSSRHVRALWQYLTLSESASQWLDALALKLKEDGYTAKTRWDYLNAVTLFLANVKKYPKHITPTEVEEYLAIFRDKNRLNPKTAKNHHLALQYFFKIILKQKDFLLSSAGIKATAQPEIFSKTEVQQIFNAVKSQKHRIMLLLAYANGLRLTEITALRKADIQIDKSHIQVKEGRNKHNRSVLLNGRLKKVLARFTQNLTPSSYLFPGRSPASHISARAASLLLNRACKKAGLAGGKNMLKLRHSFVAHLLDCGLDMDCIQKLLAHFPEASPILSRKDMAAIQSSMEKMPLALE